MVNRHVNKFVLINTGIQINSIHYQLNSILLGTVYVGPPKLPVDLKEIQIQVLTISMEYNSIL